MVVSAFVLRVADHKDHDVGTSGSSLDRKSRVDWAWSAVHRSPMARKGSVKMLRLDVQAGTINSKDNGPYAELFKTSIDSASQVLPLLARSWSPSAPTTLCGNFSKKLGAYERMKNKLVPHAVDEKGKVDNIQEYLSTPMVDVDGTKRAVWAMLVASVFAADLSVQEGAPVVVLGRPPGHHATCGHLIDIDAPIAPSPGGALIGCCLLGGCFYPSSWVAAVHSLRQGDASRLAYIDVDAHRPDGIWKEVDHFRRLGKDKRTALLGNASGCERLLFASVHIDSFPNPGVEWKSVNCVLPKSHKQAFDVSVVEELLPEGMNKDGKTTNAEFLGCYNRWQKDLLGKLKSLKPNGCFVGLGFDLHAEEKQIKRYKRVGIGLTAKHYRRLLAALPASGLQRGPVVLTLEGGYTKEGVMDGMRGVLDGLVELSRGRKRTLGKGSSFAARHASGKRHLRATCSRMGSTSEACPALKKRVRK